MKFYLKTKKECDAIVERNDAFIKTDRVIEGYNVVIYDYRLASLSDFVKDEAFELRGLTFVENPETGEWERNLLMNKFFNILQYFFPIISMGSGCYFIVVKIKFPIIL
jgi:hypothetical protein